MTDIQESVLSKAASGGTLRKETNASISKISPPSKKISPALGVSRVSSRPADQTEPVPDDSKHHGAGPDKVLNDENGRSFYLGPSPMASLLSQANNDIHHLKDKFGDRNLQKSAEGSLSELSMTFAAINFEDASNIRTNVRNFRRSSEIFFIPEKEEGLRMIQSKTLSLRYCAAGSLSWTHPRVG
jgi:hypothetical protein